MKEREMIEKNAVDPKIRLSHEQEVWLDERLASQPQARVSQMVRDLPSEEPELIWRSELSGRLHDVAAQKERKRKIAWTMRPAVGLCAATALAVVFMYRPQPQEGPATARVNVEAQVISAHREAVQLSSFWGSVRADEEARVASAPLPSEYQWEESDLGTL
jgi:hypothetical protein